MIVKSIGAKAPGSYGRLISYILRPEAVLLDKAGQPVTIRHNVFGSAKEIEEQFKNNNSLRLNHRSNNNLLLHTILALSEKNKEDITPAMLEHLSREYIRLLDPDSLAFGAVHMSGNPHAHILVSASNLLGHSTRVSREEFQRIKQELQAIQMRDYPELSESVVEHGGGHMARSDREYQIQRAGRVSRKDELKEVIAASFELSHSREEFFSQLAEEGLNVYERGGEVKGVEDEQRNYRFQTFGIEMAELDKREERLRELECREEDKELKKDDIQREGLSTEEQRMRELDELGDL
jgi:hypothetical protein